MTIEELIERLDKAEGPNYELEREIQAAFEPDRKIHVPRPYTASIDAAATLCGRLLPGVSWSTGQILPDLAAAYVHVPAAESPAVQAISKTPAIALCLAILKAKHGEQRP